jgi:hypothetical protein
MRGDRTNSPDGCEATAPEKKRGKTRGGSAKRGGQVEAQPDGNLWCDKKLRRRRARVNMTASCGR